MKVLLVADVVGGVRTFVAELARGLVADGVELHLALIGPGVPGELAGLELGSVQARDLRLEWMPDPWTDVERTAEWVEELVGLYRPDVLHANTFTPIRDAEVPLLLTVHSCVLSWWRAVHGGDAPEAWAAYRGLARGVLDRAGALAAPSAALLAELQAIHGPIPGARVIPNGRSITPSLAGGASRERLVVTAGRLWDEAKNASLVARAASAIDGRVVLIGPHPMQAPWDGAAEATGELAPGEVLRWLRRAAVFAAPARYEPFGYAALEAALCGCALVLGDIPSLREVWGEAAEYVAPDDGEALARVVNRLLSDEDRRRCAAHAAAQRAARYDAAAMAARYREAYADLPAEVMAP